MRRIKLLKWCGMFLAAMLLFTFLSRAADSASTAQIQVQTPQNQMISHVVTGSGQVESTQETALFTESGQKVAQVLVQAGEKVSTGQAVIRLLDSTLKASIQAKEDEIEETELKLSDLNSQQEVNAQKKADQQLRASQDLDTAVSNGDINIANARQEVEIAQQRLQEYRDQKAAAEAAEKAAAEAAQAAVGPEGDFTDGEETGGISDGSVTDGGTDTGDSTDSASSSSGSTFTYDSSTEQSLIDNVRAKQDALNQAIMSRNQDVTTADRAVHDSKIEDAQDSTETNLDRQLTRLKEDLQKLSDLQANNGEIRASSDGVVKSLSVQTGGQTTEEAVAIISGTSGSMQVTGTISKEELAWVKEGAAVTLTGNGNAKTEDAVVQSVQESGEDADSCTVLITVPEGSFEAGANVNFSIQQDNGPYKCCVPLSALYGTEEQPFVFVLDTEDSVLGEIQVVRKVTVQVQEKNTETAALADGSLSSAQKVVISADRDIEDGSRVRMAEE